jgi:hypothetical protein
VEQTPATTAQTPATEPPGTGAASDPAPTPARPGFATRGRMRRRARFLRKARELAYRDLGGLVFNLHRFGQQNDELVLAKLRTLEQIDRELRALESSLGEREDVTVLREAGVTACARCAAIHSSEDRFCPRCGLSVSRHTDLPIAGAAGSADPSPAASAGQPAPADGSARAPASPADGSAAAPGSPARPASEGGETRPSTPAQRPGTAPGAQRPGERAAPVSPPGDAPASAPPSGGSGEPAPDFSAQRASGSQPPPEQSSPQRDQDQPTKVVRPPAGGA